LTIVGSTRDDARAPQLLGRNEAGAFDPRLTSWRSIAATIKSHREVQRPPLPELP
jgi:hypothetical protein